MKTAIATAAILCVYAALAPHAGERDRVASMAISAVAAILRAEAAYAALNHGRYTTPACLAAPACSGLSLPGQLVPLEPNLAVAREWRVYRLEFHAVPGWSPNDMRKPPSITRFAVVAAPIDSAPNYLHALCGDSRGVIYVAERGAEGRVHDGRCIDWSRTLGTRPD